MKKLILILSILTSSTIGICQNAEEFSDLAKMKKNQKDYQYALVLIDKAIYLNDTNQWYYLTKSDIQFEMTGPLDAIKIVEQAIAIDKNKPEPYNFMGVYYESAGMNDSALIMYNMAIDHADTDTAKYIYIANRGGIKTKLKDFDGAIKDYEATIEFNPKETGALNNMAYLYDEMGMTEKAIESFKKIILIDDSFMGPYVNLGFIYSNIDSLDLAIEYFDKAIQIDPEQPLIYSNRGYAYYKKGDYSRALKDINRSIKDYPTNSYAYRNLALVYIAMDKTDEACTALNYAAYYGFEEFYGSEVTELKNKYCTK